MKTSRLVQILSSMCRPKFPRATMFLLLLFCAGLMASISDIRFSCRNPDRRPMQAKGMLKSLELAVRNYEMDLGAFPPSLDLLTQSLGSGPYWSGPLTDPWGAPVKYRRLEGGYKLRSLGPDGTLNTEDDLVVQDQVYAH